MWAYIKDNKLQDPKNKQMIKCDEKLSKVIYTAALKPFNFITVIYRLFQPKSSVASE